MSVLPEPNWISSLTKKQLSELFKPRGFFEQLCTRVFSGHALIALGQCIAVMDGIIEGFPEEFDAWFLIESELPLDCDDKLKFIIYVQSSAIRLVSQNAPYCSSEVAAHDVSRVTTIVVGQGFDAEGVRQWRKGANLVLKTGDFRYHSMGGIKRGLRIINAAKDSMNKVPF